MLREDAWPADTRFLVFEEDWRLRPDDNDQLLASLTTEEAAKLEEPPDAEPYAASTAPTGSVAELRARHAASERARPVLPGQRPGREPPG